MQRHVVGGAAALPRRPFQQPPVSFVLHSTVCLVSSGGCWLEYLDACVRLCSAVCEMCGINGLPIAEPKDEDFAEALLALSGVPEEPVEDVETTHQVDPSQQVDDRFYCPFPGCRRSFAELWRLKVHYR